MRISSTHCDGKIQGREYLRCGYRWSAVNSIPKTMQPEFTLFTFILTSTVLDLVKLSQALSSDPGTASLHPKADSPELGPQVCQ
jgi:hypothetical protein